MPSPMDLKSPKPKSESQDSEHWTSSQDSQGFGPALDLSAAEMAAIDLIDVQYHAKAKALSSSSGSSHTRVAIEPETSPKGLSATNLATYHHLNCDLYLFNSYHTRDQRQSASKEKFQPAADAQFSKGNTWESSLFTWLEARNLLRHIEDEIPLSSDALADIFVEGHEQEVYLSGVTFIPPTFSEEFAAQGVRPVAFSLAKPDLIKLKRIEIDGHDTTIWEVIDAKSSRQIKTSHHVQIGWYAKCLSNLLPSIRHGIRIVPSEVAAVWLPPLGSLPMPVPLSYVFAALDELIFKRLPAIVYSRRQEVSWHFNPLCTGCSWVGPCRTNAIKQKKLGVIPNIPPDAAAMILDVLPRQRRETDIEELHKLFADHQRLAILEQERPTSIRRIKKYLAVHSGRKLSAVLQAASTDTPQVTMRRTYAFPREEDLAVYVSVLLDASSRILSYRVDVFRNNGEDLYPHDVGRTDLISDLANVIRWIASREDTPRVQFYTFTSAEHHAIQQYFIDAALSVDVATDTHLLAQIRTCIAILCDGAGVLSTMFQPTLLKDVLTDLLGKSSTYIKKAHLQECLSRLSLDSNGKVSELRDRLAQHLATLKAGDNTTSTNRTLGNLPPIVVIQNEVERLVALPSPGFWGLAEAVDLLCDDTVIAPSDDTLLGLASDDDSTHLDQMLYERNFACFSLNSAVRDLINEATQHPETILINEARTLPSDSFMDLCKEPRLRKLFWMQQFEVTSRMQELSHSRRDGCPDAILLRFMHSRKEGRDMHYNFTVEDGALDLAAERDVGFFEWLIVEDSGSSDTSIPVENYFDDLQFCSTLFGLGQVQSWKDQHPDAVNTVMVANIAYLDPVSQLVALQVYPWDNAKFYPGKMYRLTPRLIDFNFSKVMRALLALDWETRSDTSPAFVSLLRDPTSFASSANTNDALLTAEGVLQRRLKELARLEVDGAAALVFKDSQHKAAQRLLKSRLLVLHGPPGTGKTYTIALSLLRFVECCFSLPDFTSQTFFVTAVTHAAIEAFLKKIDYLRNAYKSVAEHTSHEYDIRWLDTMQFDHVLRGGDHKKISDRKMQTYVYCGTAYQLDNFARKSNIQCDAVFIDEASQMGVATSSLVLRWLKNDDSKVILAGDHLQLGTIVAAQYPNLRPPLFGSILDFIVNEGDSTPFTAGRPDSYTSSASSQDGPIVQITENFRLNPDLADFVSIIYKRRMLSMKSHTRHAAEALKSLRPLRSGDDVTRYLNALGNAMLSHPQHLLTPPQRPFGTKNSGSEHIYPTSLALFTLDVRESTGQSTYESHVKCEALLAALLAGRLGAAIPNTSVFIATPHRIQRTAVKAQLASDALSGDVDELADSVSRMSIRPKGGRRSGSSSGSPSKTPARSPARQRFIVDTVERLQGQEADIVICCLAHTHRPTLLQDLSFLFERRRLNVAISRAKMLCIVISSREVLRPPLHVLADPQSAQGYAFLHAYEERAWKGHISLQL